MLQQKLSEIDHFRIKPINRALLGLTLIERGVIGPGLRQLGLSCEICQVEQKGVMMVFFLLGLWKARKCSTVSFIMERMENDREYEDLRKVLLKVRKINVEQSLTEFFSEEDQPVQDSYLTKEKGSLKARLIKYSMINVRDIAETILEEGFTETGLDLLYKSVTELMPLVSALELTELKPLLFMYEEELLKGKEDIINEILETKLVRKDKKNLKDQVTEVEFRNLFQVKTLTSFLFLYEGKFIKARISLNFLIDIYLQIIRKVDISTDDKTYGYENIRSLILLSSYCLSHESGPCDVYRHFCNDKRFSDLETSLKLILHYSDKMNTFHERKLGRLEIYFLVLGNLNFEIFLHQNIQKSKDSCQEEESNKELLINAMRHYVLVINTKPLDDSSVFPVYDAILTLLVLFGGLSIRSIWAFSFFKTLRKIRCTSVEMIDIKNYELPQTMVKFVEDNREIVQSLLNKEKRLTNREKQALFQSKSCEQMRFLPLTRILRDETTNSLKIFDVKLKSGDHFHSNSKTDILSSSQSSVDMDASSQEETIEIEDSIDVGDELIIHYIKTLKEQTQLNDRQFLEKIDQYLVTLSLQVTEC